MALKRSEAETILIKRCGKKMAVAGLSTDATGANEDLSDALSSALMDMGYQPQSYATVTDADLAVVPAEQVAELLDRAELRTLENIAGNLDLVDLSVGPRSESLSDLSSQVEKAIDRLITRISRYYGDTSLTAGTLTLDFQAKD